LKKIYADGNPYELDGVSAEYTDWHFNVRQSNTEPLLRLNLEGLTPEIMEKRRDEVLGIIRGYRPRRPSFFSHQEQTRAPIVVHTVDCQHVEL
jgi:hypothetical protein